MKLTALCAVLGGSLLCFSCIGSFGLWNSLKGWNQGLGNKFVNELVFIVLSPAYAVAYLADVLVLNSIEFWSGSNPMADRVGTEQIIHGEDGEYIVRINEDGYTIMKMGEADRPLDLVYDEENRTWNAVAEGQSIELMTMNEDGSITYKDQKGEKVTVMPELIKDAVAAR